MTQPTDQQQPPPRQGPSAGTAVAVAALATGAADPFLPLRYSALATLVRAERRLYGRYRALLHGWLDEVRPRVVSPRGAIDAFAARTLRHAFAQGVDDVVDVVVREIFEDGWDSVMLHTPVPPPYVDRYLAGAKNRLVNVPDQVYSLVRGEVSKATSEGWDIGQLASRVEDVLTANDASVWPGRGLVVARTEAIGAYNAGQLAGFKGYAATAGGQWEKAWLCTHDLRVRPTHLAADVGTPETGQRVPLDEAFSVGDALLDHPGADAPRPLPEEVIQCVVGSTQVAWTGQRVEAATRRRKVGTFLKLCTRRGHVLTVTPNHPVLTPLGYRRAGELAPRDYVMATGFPPAPEVADGPPSIEQVHRALSETGMQERVMGGQMDFHGDGAETEVQVVRTDCDLGNQAYAERLGQDGELVFDRLDGAASSLPGSRGAVAALLNVDRSEHGKPSGTAGLVGGGGHHAAGGLVESAHSQDAGLSLGPDDQAEFVEAAGDDWPTYAESLRHLEHALALGMAPTDIVKIERYTGDHEVFNLSTSGQWYSANGIALHNCRCAMLLLRPGEAPDLSHRHGKG